MIDVVVTSAPGWTVSVTDGVNTSHYTYPDGTAHEAADKALSTHKLTFKDALPATDAVSITI